MKAVAVNLAALGDTEPLWRDWLEDARRRFRVDVAQLAEQLPNWRQLLKRFSEERAPVYFRRDSDAATALRRLQANGIRVGVFADAPEELTRVALAHLGAAGRVELVETGEGARDRLLAALGNGARIVDTRAELVGLT